MYRVKEMFYSLQGEGARAGRASVFCRFSKCNLWNGREESRLNSFCRFCDTDILGTDGQNGGVFDDAISLAKAIEGLWPSRSQSAKPYVVFTGGEPLLQLDNDLIQAVKKLGFEVAIETNGTLPMPTGVDWICLSPKGVSEVVIEKCDELKLVYPQDDCPPNQWSDFDASYFFLSPMADPLVKEGKDTTKELHTQQALHYCLENPQWRLSLQQHKLLGID